MDTKTVPCSNCGKGLRIGTTLDGTMVIQLDGTEVNMCHRCHGLLSGVPADVLDEVWG